jgi:hypothetical protein
MQLFDLFRKKALSLPPQFLKFIIETIDNALRARQVNIDTQGDVYVRVASEN